MAIDSASLTLGEIATVEKLGGYSLASLDDSSAPKGNMLAALALVYRRRQGHPEFSWNEATALTITEAYEILGIKTTEASDAIATTEDKAPKASRSAKTSPATPTE
ncbi:hypothetical protein [Microbacterium dextranolyticum]|uniref:Tail assembly chaperone n=1 Tax=Microbacterium dextranolyticum TaxID=36806 RepID=A0A9W6M6U4_9MICO|nr:hypothetical protein [Microbacterium dextranolyticum]MBM7462910.1 hypothetical protein [Microbacterium dextranolyticum]GLJ95985.1 hypothetical protein GCM10017591_20480 [Microbacterium dextranolyticum]